MGSVLKSIQAVLEAGMCIFPCRPDKTPYVRWKEQASYDKRQVRDWWKQWPQAMIGLPTGRENGVWALDIDRHKEDADGFSSLAALEAANGSLPETWTQTTPSGGEHRIFKYPEGLPEETKIPNSAGALGPGLDVRGDGGYIILAPSRTNDERAYQTIRGAEFLHSAPVWLLNMAARSAGPEEDMTAPDMASRDEPAATSNLNDREKRYLEAAIKAELKNVRSALAGGRNDALNKAAFALGQFVGGGCLEQDAVKRDLLAAATAARPDASPGLPEEEAATTIDSGLTAGLNEPRKISLSPLPAGFVMLTDGLYYIAGQKKQWLGAPIEILGHVRDEANEGWGLQVRWQDLNGIAHRATIQNSSLVG
ncbi:MAG: bifunctional DNA primase/polymerase, partial [Candidatus Adiutrix sp.]|nr:bifunctional DNA primase/polymerase [Candidatus Adiutrix sp.]